MALYGAAVACLLIITIIRNEIQIWGGRAATVSAQPAEPAHITTHICSVFGDPLPYAVVYVGGRVAQADSTGLVELAGLSPGRMEMTVFAGGFQPLTLEVQLEPGANSPVIKYDTGLWPESFMADFHIYYSSEQRALLGILGFANGTAEPIYVHRAVLHTPQGQAIADLLDTGGGFEYFAGLSSKIRMVEEPRKALLWPARTWQPGEFAPIPGVFAEGAYTLEVHWGSEAEHNSGQYQVLRVTSYLDFKLSGNPHANNK